MRKGNRSMEFTWFNLLRLRNPRSPEQGGGVGPGATELVDDTAGKLGVRTRGLRILFTHQLLLSLAPRKPPRRAMEVETKTNFAAVGPAGLPPAPLTFWLCFMLGAASPASPARAHPRPTAQL